MEKRTSEYEQLLLDEENLKLRKRKLQTKILNDKREMFKIQHGESTFETMEKYKQLVYDSCHQATLCTLGHSVDVDYPKGAHEYCHRTLNPVHYEKCKPTPQVLTAFEIEGKRVSIDPIPHYEPWGN